MSKDTSADITALLVAWGQGDQDAFTALVPLVDRELHRLAAHYMARERDGHVLQPTALVNEAFLRLVDWKNVQWAERAHFFAMAATMMRRVLVDYARAGGRQKRGRRCRARVALRGRSHPTAGDHRCHRPRCRAHRARTDLPAAVPRDRTAVLWRSQPGRNGGLAERICRDRPARLEPGASVAVQGIEPDRETLTKKQKRAGLTRPALTTHSGGANAPPYDYSTSPLGALPAIGSSASNAYSISRSRSRSSSLGCGGSSAGIRTCR